MRKATSLGFAMLLSGAAPHTARAQEPLAPAPIDCAQVCCPCQMQLAELARDEREAHEGIAIGLALFIPAYVAGTAYAATLPGSVKPVDSIPIIGTIIAGTRETSRDNHAALFFSAGVQVVGALVAALSAVELANVHSERCELSVEVTGNGAALTGHW
jgi:hypothetical protein